MNKLKDIGIEESTARIIAVEAGGSQDFVDLDYLMNCNVETNLIDSAMKLVADFYFVASYYRY
ncbi:MAG: hypothetical protein IPM69_02390 [Ignavibacteria bacterium]|nr:hypothetical protein [Ignavibacteria bacterium]